MADRRAAVHTAMRSLIIRHFGTQQCAAKEIGDYWHPSGNCGEEYDTAGLSRKMSGSRLWTHEDIMAVQDITGSTRVTDIMRGNAPADTPQNLSLIQMTQELIKENAEGASALMDLTQGGCVEKAKQELLDIKETAEKHIAALEEGDNSTRIKAVK